MGRTGNRLRVALLDLHFRPYGGGPAVALWTLAEALAKDVSLTVICSRAKDAPPGVEVVELPTIPIYRFLIEFGTYRLSWSLRYQLQRLSSTFDVIHAMSPLFGPWDLATVHFCSSQYLEVLKSQKTTDHTPRARARRMYHLLTHSITSRLEHDTFQGPRTRPWQRLLPVSRSVADYLATRFRTRLPIEVLPNLVRVPPPPSRCLRQEILQAAGWNEQSFLALFVGAGQWERKGLDIAIRALAWLPDAVKIVVVGGGDTRTFEALAREAGVRSRVLFRGPTKDPGPYYAAADVFVFPSRYEAQPLVCLEALGHGLPLVATAVAGSETCLVDGFNGRVVADTPESVATAVGGMYLDPASRIRMSASARESFREYVGAQRRRVLERLLEIYAEVAQQKRQETESDG